MRIVAIDPALTMGVAIGDGDTATFHTVDVHGAYRHSAGDGLIVLRRHFESILPEADAVVIEEATPMNMLSARTQYAIWGMLVSVCADLDLQYVLYNVSTIRAWLRRWLLEHATPTEIGELTVLYEKHKPAKRPAIIRHHLVYGPVLDHNIADASALLGLAQSELKPCLTY